MKNMTIKAKLTLAIGVLVSMIVLLVVFDCQFADFDSYRSR